MLYSRSQYFVPGIHCYRLLVIIVVKLSRVCANILIIISILAKMVLVISKRRSALHDFDSRLIFIDRKKWLMVHYKIYFAKVKSRRDSAMK